MNLTHRLLVVTIATAVALPSAVFAAKADRKKNATPAATFATIDKDSDGVISEAEFLAAEKGKVSDEAAKSRFAAMDKNSDGKLAKDEFTGTGDEPKKKRKKKDKNAN